jgi:adenosylmethionine-8-amino-7-oxononanoate aminotransferase
MRREALGGGTLQRSPSSPAGAVAAVFLEPVPGANGVLVPPATYWPIVRKACDEHGVLLVADEVLCGFGRTGKPFGHQHWGVVPDMITVAKGLAFRPLAVTAKDTLEWAKTRTPEQQKALAEGALAGLSASREAEVLSAWHAKRKTGSS